MNKKRPIYRICAYSKEKILKEDLFRIVKNEHGIYFDENQSIPGRGVYLKKDLKTILAAQKAKTLSRGLRSAVSDEIYLELIQALNRERKK